MRVTAGVKASSISPANAGLASRSMRPNGASYRQCDGATGSEKDQLNLGGTIRLRHDVNDI